MVKRECGSVCVLTVLSLSLLVASARGAGDALDILVVDTEGGKAVIVKAPGGESLLVDAGYPRDDERDTKRIVSAAHDMGIRKLDYVVATHYDADHSGNVARVDVLLPARVFVDHGAPMAGCTQLEHFESYLKAIGGRKRLSLRPGDEIPLAGVKIRVVSSGGEVLSRPLSGAGQPNALCAAQPDTADAYDNAGSLGLLFEFGKFRMLDLGDLLARQEYGLVCPANRIGLVDLFMVSHHGFAVSNSAFLVHAIRPRVAIMNNGPSKGGEPRVFETLLSSPGFRDLWQMHAAPLAQERNMPERMIANLTANCEGKPIRILARRDGSFSVTNTRSGYTASYAPR
jgi:beta-lactamase superfamily II metal-dependent hydrolase